ncbi:Adenylate cyclase [Candidatus Rhodobacter oscarellae]|uniref:Adenylate cyclase n=1 Tax=Candidatus Rhodobacter oscarellae TaxID=1675527 RepID=A0A0J9EAP1_9RHOB|nr:winged helix-turn-helix domain-containing protein [Candidatus Rhodobacter lobularis]KMW59681.1 Adenylate cyclase [Candidatus Rhodobacter lobularis]
MKIEISDARVDFDRMTAERGDDQRRLTRQTAGILRALVDADDQIVSKDDLIDRVWDGRIVTDATLSTAIKEARHAVGDTGADQRIIETVHGMGFRLRTPARRIETLPIIEQDAPCLLVLPFRNTSADPDARFIPEGLTDEIITGLSRFPDVKVLSRTTSDAAQTAAFDPAQMKHKYDADFIVEGSVRRTETRLRVSVQLASTQSGSVLLSEQIDSEATVQSVFDVQDHIAQICAARMAGPHGPVAQGKGGFATERVHHESWTLFRLVADFRRYYRTYDFQLHAALRDAFPPALARHPDASDGWAAYAVLLLEEFRYHVNERADFDALTPASEAAERAVAADPRNAFAQTALAMCRLYVMDIAGFDEAADKALALNPGNSDVLSEIGHCYAFIGREAEAIALLDKAIELSPEHPGWYHFAKTWRYARLDMFNAALLELQRHPMHGFYWYHAHLVWLHSACGDHAAAQSEAEILRDVFPAFEARAMDELAMWDANRDLVASALEHWARAGLNIVETADPATAI